MERFYPDEPTFYKRKKRMHCILEYNPGWDSNPKPRAAKANTITTEPNNRFPDADRF